MRKFHTKRILVLGINFAPELTGIGKYTGEMVRWLADGGYECTVVTGFPYYPHWVVQAPYRGMSYKREVLMDGKIKVYRCPLYVPAWPTAVRRIIHDASFFLSTFVLLSYMMFKPGHDYIFCVAPPFHLGFLALYYRLFKGGKMIYHIQDLQIDAAKDLGIFRSEKLINMLFALERSIIKFADEISTISSGMVRKIAQKTDKPIHIFRNWVDTDSYRPVGDIDAVKKKFGFLSSDKIVLYSGSIGEKQGLEAIVHAARELSAEAELKFLICGSGPYKEELQNLADELSVSNVIFFPLQPAESFNEFCNIADLHLILQKANASDLVMPSKLTTILAVGGLALVTAVPGSGLYDEIKENGIGILVEAEDANALVEGIRHALANDNRRIRENARKYAEKHLSPAAVFPALIQVMEN